MFDKLIVCEPEGAEIKNRRRYFLLSSLVVGMLFASAVVASIYAADFNLGKGNLELVEMVAPPDLLPVEPETPEPVARNNQSSSSDLPTRQVNMARVDEAQFVPPTVSTTGNRYESRPLSRFELSGNDTNPNTSGRVVQGEPEGSRLLTAGTQAPDEVEKPLEAEPPPPVRKVEPPKRPVSVGVVNGRAENLVKPAYTAAMKALGLTGKVDVQVTIDEFGKVVSANAVSGHPILKPAAEQAARQSRFTPTLLSKVPVKVTGVIVYNFTR